VKLFNNTTLKYIFILITALSACETNRFDSDKRQIAAKDEVRNKIGRVSNFDIVSFKEDTLRSFTDTNFIHPIQYTLDFIYKDSNNTLQRKKGLVIFTPKANQIISCIITDQ